MQVDVTRLSAIDAVTRLKQGEVTPLELIDAAAARIAVVEPLVNALPTLCLERARDHAKRLMAQRSAETEAGRGWLAGLPIVIKDLMDVEGVRTTYGSPLFRDHVPTTSHPLVRRIERRGGIIIGKSNTPEFGAGGNTFNEVFGRTLNPWNTSLTCGGSTGGGAVAVATGEAWLAQGSDHGGSLRGPATLCSVVGIRPSPGRVTRGTANTLFSPLSVQGPMARNVLDLALFLDTMAGLCPSDPLTFDAPVRSFLETTTEARPPRRVAFTANFGGRLPVDRETRDICSRAVRQFEQAGCVVEEDFPKLGPVEDVFLALRSQQFVVDRELQIAAYRDQIKPDIIWNTEHGLSQSTSRLAWAERERAALYRRFAAFFERHDIFVTPGSATPAWDVALRARDVVDGVKLENYIAGSTLTSAITLTSCPAVAVPCGFDTYAARWDCRLSLLCGVRRRHWPQPACSSWRPVWTGCFQSTQGLGSSHPELGCARPHHCLDQPAWPRPGSERVPSRPGPPRAAAAVQPVRQPQCHGRRWLYEVRIELSHLSPAITAPKMPYS